MARNRGLLAKLDILVFFNVGQIKRGWNFSVPHHRFGVMRGWQIRSMRPLEGLCEVGLCDLFWVYATSGGVMRGGFMRPLLGLCEVGLCDLWGLCEVGLCDLWRGYARWGYATSFGVMRPLGLCEVALCDLWRGYATCFGVMRGEQILRFFTPF